MRFSDSPPLICFHARCALVSGTQQVHIRAGGSQQTTGDIGGPKRDTACRRIPSVSSALKRGKARHRRTGYLTAVRPFRDSRISRCPGLYLFLSLWITGNFPICRLVFYHAVHSAESRHKVGDNQSYPAPPGCCLFRPYLRIFAARPRCGVPCVSTWIRAISLCAALCFTMLSIGR